MNRNTWIALISLLVVGALALGGVAVAASGEDDAEGPDQAITGAALDRASAAALDHLGEGEVTDTEVGDEESYYEVEVTLPDGSEVDVQLDENFAVVGDEPESQSEDAAEEDDEDAEGEQEDADDAAEDEAEGSDQAITGDALDRAAAAALEFTGEGEVTDTEVGDEESYYEVEVTLPDGSYVDVQLDEDFTVVGTD